MVDASGSCLVGLVLFFFMLVATDPGDNLVLVEAGFTTGRSGSRVVAGTVRNATDRTCAQVRARIDLLDGNDSVVGETFAITDALGAGETWMFEAPVDAEHAVRFRVSVTSPENTRPAGLGGCPTTICPARTGSSSTR